jgi:hypothetical protein
MLCSSFKLSVNCNFDYFKRLSWNTDSSLRDVLLRVHHSFTPKRLEVSGCPTFNVTPAGTLHTILILHPWCSLQCAHLKSIFLLPCILCRLQNVSLLDMTPETGVLFCFAFLCVIWFVCSDDVRWTAFSLLQETFPFVVLGSWHNSWTTGTSSSSVPDNFLTLNQRTTELTVSFLCRHTLVPRWLFLNPLRPSGNYMNHLLWQSVMLHFVFIGFVWFWL